MAQPFDAGEQPTDVTASLTLETDVNYAVQNLSDVARLFFLIRANRPNVRARAFRVDPGSWGYFSFEAGEKVWFWSNAPPGSTCPVLVIEAVQ